MAKGFVQQHKKEEWFKECYVPELRDAYHKKLTSFRQGALAQFENDLESGYFDGFTLEGIYKTESNGAGGVVEREEGETVAAAEVLGVGDLVPSLGGDLRDDAALQPALLIKTLAPMVSREKIEEFCKEHLGESDGGFRWLSLSDPNPQKKCHRIGWIMLNGAPDSANDMAVDRSDGRDGDNEGFDGEPRNIDTLESSTAPTTTAEKALLAVNSKTIYDTERGDFTCHVGIHQSTREPRKKALWDLFSAPDRVERDLELARRVVQKFDSDMGAEGLEKIDRRVQLLRSRGAIQAPVNQAQPKPKTEDDEMADADRESGEEGEEEEEGAIDEDVDDEDLLITKKTLDIIVEYLRRVYNFCLFCVFESDSVHELTRKCPGGHLRRPRASLGSAAKSAAKASVQGKPFPMKRSDSITEADRPASPAEEKKPNFRGNSKADQQLQRAFNWVKTYEEKILQLLDPDDVDIKKLGGIPLEDALDEELEKFVKQEDESKFRCKVPDCTKLFRGRDFWRKHVEKRHTDWYNSIKSDVSINFSSLQPIANDVQLALVNNYVLDPSHIAPSRSDANSNGHFPINPSLTAQGTPRGFNLGSIPGMPPGFSGFPGSMLPNFGNHAVGLPPNWNTAGDSIGPMRRNNRNGQNNRAGPYDRRQPRFNNGRSSPRGNGATVNGRGGDGGQGVSGIGPNEATAGRALKSYQDLDAVAGGGSGELNY